MRSITCARDNPAQDHSTRNAQSAVLQQPEQEDEDDDGDDVPVEPRALDPDQKRKHGKVVRGCLLEGGSKPAGAEATDITHAFIQAIAPASNRAGPITAQLQYPKRSCWPAVR